MKAKVHNAAIAVVLALITAMFVSAGVAVVASIVWLFQSNHAAGGFVMVAVILFIVCMVTIVVTQE